MSFLLANLCNTPGVSSNLNRRTRLLLKILALSDVALYRTRAERLHNDMFVFLKDASNVYCEHFSSELEVRDEIGTFCSVTLPSLFLLTLLSRFHYSVLRHHTCVKVGSYFFTY